MARFTRILEKIGLGPKRSRPVGQTLESGRDSSSKNNRGPVIVKCTILFALVAFALMAFPGRPSFELGVQEGDVWRDDDLAAPFDFPIFKSEEQWQAERRDVRRTTPPVFAEVPTARPAMEERIDSLSGQLRLVFNEYASWQRNLVREQYEEAADDSARYSRMREDLPLRVTQRQWNLLRDSFAASVPGVSVPFRLPAGERPLDQHLFANVRTIGSELLDTGVLDVPSDSIRTQDVVVRNLQERTERRVNMNDLLTFDEALSEAEARFREIHSERPDTVALGMALFREVFQPSLAFLPTETEQRVREAIETISPAVGKVQAGQILIRQGEVVTEATRAQLESLARIRAERAGYITAWKASLSHYIPTLATFFMFFLYLFLLRRPVFDDNKQVLLISILFAATIAFFAVVVRLPNIPGYIVPVAIVSILLTVIYDSRVGMFGTLTLALLGGLYFGFDYEYTFATLFAGTLAVFSVRDIKNRGQFIVTAGLVLGAYVIITGAFSLARVAPWDRFSVDLVQAAANSLLLLLAYPLLWVFERTFNITTDVTLLELSDTNQPLLKELSLRAPGTFNHTLQVANLAEAAATAVGANALMARVGALYHDIGKILKAEYFVENQRPGMNPHDRLSPHMSALILASHVKDGVELGKQHKLPQVVLDFIPMHHGTSRIEYFYRRAVEQQKPGDPEVADTEFRYPGPRPDTNETGIMLLADSVEAASRSIAKPTRKRLEDLIDSLFKARIEDGQLDDCPLTFADLRVIRNVFLSVLSGVYHFRVKYPGQEEEEARSEASEDLAADNGADKPATQRYDSVSHVETGSTQGDDGNPDGGDHDTETRNEPEEGARKES